MSTASIGGTTLLVSWMDSSAGVSSTDGSWDSSILPFTPFARGYMLFAAESAGGDGYRSLGFVAEAQSMGLKRGKSPFSSFVGWPPFGSAGGKSPVVEVTYSLVPPTWHLNTVNVRSKARKYFLLLLWCLFGYNINSVIRWIVNGGTESNDARVDDTRAMSSCSDCKSSDGIDSDDMVSRAAELGNKVLRFWEFQVNYNGHIKPQGWAYLI